MTKRSWQQYSHQELHRQLCDVALSGMYTERDEIGSQALSCPYYVPLEGKLGADWGVIVNPNSSRFGKLTFEHDDCGCPVADSEDENGWGRHHDTPSQDGDMWEATWTHRCDDLCATPCSWNEQPTDRRERYTLRRDAAAQAEETFWQLYTALGSPGTPWPEELDRLARLAETARQTAADARMWTAYTYMDGSHTIWIEAGASDAAAVIDQHLERCANERHCETCNEPCWTEDEHADEHGPGDESMWPRRWDGGSRYTVIGAEEAAAMLEAHNSAKDTDC